MIRVESDAEGSKDPAKPSLIGRTLAPGVLILLALFLGGLTVGVLGAEVSGPPIFGILIRAFFGLIVGGTALGLLVLAIQSARGVRADARKLPSVLERLCPACGEIAPSGASECGHCERPLGCEPKDWTTEPKAGFLTLFLFAIGGGLACLGVIVAAGPFYDGDRRLWVLVAAGALGLLLGGVGVVMLVGSVGILAEDLSRKRRWSFTNGEEQGPEYSSASVLLARNRLREAAGVSHHCRLLYRQAKGASTFRRAPLVRAFAAALRKLQADCVVAVVERYSIEWIIEAQHSALDAEFPRPNRSEGTTLLALVEKSELESSHPLLDVLRPHLERRQSVIDLFRAVERSPETRERLLRAVEARGSRLLELDPLIPLDPFEAAICREIEQKSLN